MKIKTMWSAILYGVVLLTMTTVNGGRFSDTNDLLGRAIRGVRNLTDTEDRQMNLNGEEDMQLAGHGKMEMLIRILEEKERFLQEMASRHGGEMGTVDPNDELQRKYEQLQNEIMEEYNGTFIDLEMEFNTGNDTVNTSSTSSSDLQRGKRWNWGGYWARWPKAVVPYEYDGGDEVGARNAMDRYEELTCMRFVHHIDETTNNDLSLGHHGYLKYIKGNGCWSMVGNHRSSGGQSISCCADTTCVHELGHAFGMMHEQNSPWRDGWIRANLQNVIKGDEGIYQRGSGHFSLGYDITSIMHYKPHHFSRGHGKPTMTVLVDRTHFTDEDFYMFREINDVQECKDVDACSDFAIECKNDGYISVISGKCQCRCPLGLDPTTGCTTPLKTSSITADMPRGQYALLKPDTGCPDSTYSFKEGALIHYGEGRNYDSGDVLAGDITGTKAEHQFCIHSDEKFDGIVEGFLEPKSTWPVGKYCILRAGGECPRGMKPGHVKYGDMNATEETKNSHIGDLPDGSFGDDTRFEFCCQINGIERDVTVFPVSKPFILFPVDFKECQAVLGMKSKRYIFTFDSFDEKGYEIDGVMGKIETDMSGIMGLEYCYYTKSDMNCGDIITLSAENPEAVIDIDAAGRTDLDCTWLVKGDSEDGNVVINFEEFNVECTNPLEVRFARIGQRGALYCNKDMDRSVKSVFDKVMLKLKTTGQSATKVKVVARWVPNSDMCYDVSDQGVTYSGDVSYTKDLVKCLPWSNVTICPHHPWAVGDELANLDGNSCRNPDNSFGPWCYTETDVNGCKRNYCDVCHTENLFDRDDDCQKKKGAGFCSEDPAAALHNCALTCRDALPNMGPDEKYTDIRCDPPTAPVDGVLVGETKAKYALGEEVKFKCKHGGRSLSKMCLSGGDWTPLGSVCIECPLGSVIKGESCYIFVDRQMNYIEAKEECNNIGGQAAMPKTSEQNDFIMEVSKGSTVWLGISDREIEGTWVYEDGTPADWVNWGGDEPNNWRNEEHCASLEAKTKLWADRVCDYTSSWAKMAVVCEVPKVNTLVCADYLEEKRCVALLTAKPSMCHDYPSYVEEYCAKTCGVCGDESVSCSINSQGPDVKTSTDKASISVGDDVTFSCKEGTAVVEGNERRACLPSGELTGTPLVCEDPSKQIVTVNVGVPVISRLPYPLPPGSAFTGENAQWTIRDEGEIIAWEFYSNSPSEHAFQVWRVIDSKSKYQLIGQTVLTTGNDMEQRHELPKDERIQVQPGDIIGLWKADRGGVRFNKCDPKIHPTWIGTSFSIKKATAPSDFKVGEEEDFKSAWGCATYGFRAVIAVKP